jgi:orotate phosphoribosyltransferase-like protein
MDNDIERLIKRVRTLIDYGLSKKEIADALGDRYDQGQIFLAYNAAKILLSDT